MVSVNEAKDIKSLNFSGIPEAVFMNDVDAFMKRGEHYKNVENIMKSLEEQHAKYRFMQVNLFAKANRLKSQIPLLKNSLKIVQQLSQKKIQNQTADLHFFLSDQVYVKALVPPTDKVYLWLGANIMLEYELGDAEDLLQKNLLSATKNLQQIEHDLDFLRDQCTTTEVNMARIHNWDVKKRQSVIPVSP